MSDKTMSENLLTQHTFQVGDQTFRGKVVALDKDGLLFDHHSFIRALNQERIRAARTKYGINPDIVIDWMTEIGIAAHIGPDGEPVADACLPDGTAILASIEDEVVISGVFFMHSLKIPWPEARAMALEVHTTADDALRWQDVLTTHQGCPEIFSRLRKKGVPYGIVTLDTSQRVREMIDMVDESESLSFILSSSEITNCKPDPEAIIKTADLFGVSCNEIIMIGDLPVDMEMANLAGAVGVAVPEGSFFEEELRKKASYVCKTLDDFIILD
ncbi:MAG: HAD family hydrolase [Oscillospiraceae bacterium]|nr:HAD family hydrolase [Oscillospiraceae bacterium]